MIEQIYSSVDKSTNEGKKAMYKAMTTPDVKISDEVGKTITIKDVVLIPTEFIEENGNVRSGVRSAIIDSDGVVHGASSIGVANSLQAIFEVFGNPTYKDGLPVTVKQISKGQNRIITLDII